MNLEIPGPKGVLPHIFTAALIATAFTAAAAAADRPTAVQAVAMGVAEAHVLNANGAADRVTVNFERPNGAREISAECFVQYTLILAKGERRTLTARLSDSKALPASCPVMLQAISSGKKNEGVGAGAVLLSAEPKAILTDLGSCATGIEAAAGTRLVFTIDAARLPRSASGDGQKALTVILSLD
jgi:hypothetical protein